MSNITPAWQQTYWDYYQRSMVRGAIKTVFYHVFHYHMNEADIWNFTRREVFPQGQAPGVLNIAPLEFDECARSAAVAALLKMR